MKKYKKFFQSKNLNFPFKKKIKINIHKNYYELIYLKNKKIYKKLSYNPEGIKKIIKERDGIIWYCKKTDYKNSKIIKNFKTENKYAELDLIEINGKKLKSWDPLVKNINYVNRLMNFYFLNFMKTKKMEIHGDLTLDNIIFKKRGLFIIDWEYFGGKKKLWGYDVAYFVLSSLCLPYICHKKIFPKDEILFINLWKKLQKNGVSKKILSSPFEYFEKEIKNDSILKKGYLISKSKFFPFITNFKYKIRIKKLINKIYE